MAQQAKVNPDGTLEIHGKTYKPVALRLKEFRQEHPDWRVTTKVLESGELVLVRCAIHDEQGAVMATGHAEEQRGAGNINRFSALENCETSAVGRALAVLGYVGTEVASADELAAQINKEAVAEVMRPLLDHIAAVRDLWPTVATIKQAIVDGQYSGGMEAWIELTDEEKRSLWRAPSKGGIFTTRERETMRSAEFRQAFQEERDE